MEIGTASKKMVQLRDENVNDINGQTFLDGIEVRRWAECIEQLLNMKLYAVFD